MGDIASACAAVLLIKAAHEWHKRHGSQLPSTSSQRSEFKDIIKSWQRQIDGIPLEVRKLFLEILQLLDLHHPSMPFSFVDLQAVSAPLDNECKLFC